MTLPVADKVTALITLAPDMLPVPGVPAVIMLPAVMFAVVVILLVELIAVSTLPLRLRLPVCTLPAFTLPVAEIRPPVKMLPPVMLPELTRLSTLAVWKYTTLLRLLLSVLLALS